MRFFKHMEERLQGVNGFISSSKALLYQLDIRPFYDFSFHVQALTNVFSHLLRAISHFLLLLKSLFLMSTSVWNDKVDVRETGVNAFFYTSSFAISLIATAFTPLTYILKSLMSFICGYSCQTSSYIYGSYQTEREKMDIMTRVSSK